MPRVKRGSKARRRRNRLLKHAKGFVAGRRRMYKLAKETVHRAWANAYRDRKRRKRDFRRLWVVRLNAAARQHGLSYSRFMHGLKASGVELDRKVLAHMAAHAPEEFARVVEVAKKAL